MKKNWIFGVIGLAIGFISDHNLKKMAVKEYETENDNLNKKVFECRELLEKKQEIIERKQEEINSSRKDRDRYKLKWEVMYRWRRLSDKGVKISEYFNRNRISKLVIYGCGEIGELLINELYNDETIQIAHIIDKNKRGFNYKDIPIFSMLQTEDIDAIVVTPVLIKEQVEKYLNLQNAIKLITIDELIEEEWKHHEMDK